MHLIRQEDEWGIPANTHGQDVLIAIDPESLAGLGNALGWALQNIETWEFDTLIGLTVDQANALCEEMGAVLRDARRPQN